MAGIRMQYGLHGSKKNGQEEIEKRKHNISKGRRRRNKEKSVRKKRKKKTK